MPVAARSLHRVVPRGNSDITDAHLWMVGNVGTSWVVVRAVDASDVPRE